ncbi:hypothetical protein SAMN06265379_10361 [Saccharicrinis carchari]|uniref:GAF domain-containing protein n=1 Tax=Saccharicrinis carchari TaxID=1168039 RepID=A0A521CEN4_SACCC|nr:GAF domain-containing protein [Saccharicrinis carchari]SMO57897.1 hypothetical protein SAMN06265379_10361 [Saccharicrinis carchari]
MSKNTIGKIYYLAGGAFLFALAKYFFIGHAQLMPKYFVFEFISFALFLSLVYVADRLLKETMAQKEETEIQTKKAGSQHKQEIERLQSTIAELSNQHKNKMSDNEDINSIATQIINKLSNCTDLNDLANGLLIEISTVYELGLGICYFYDKPSDKFTVKGSYGLSSDFHPGDFSCGEGLNGQAVADKTARRIDDVPQDYFSIESGSGLSKPCNIYLLPIVKNNNCIGLIEVAGFANMHLNKHWPQLNKSIASIVEL